MLNDSNKFIAELIVILTDLQQHLSDKSEDLKVILVRVDAAKAIVNEKENAVSTEVEIIIKNASKSKKYQMM